MIGLGEGPYPVRFDRPPEGAVQLLVRGEVVALPLKGVIDLNAERARLQKELAGKGLVFNTAKELAMSTLMMGRG